MPDISKLSGALIDSVGKVDGVLKGDIASIAGVTVPSSGAYTPPLDTYSGAAFAFSVRKLRTDYTGDCMQVYRVDDGATQEVGFDSNGLLDIAAIETFGGSSVVKISIWYDQSGNGNNGTNTNVNRYPRIYDGTDIEKDEWGNPYAVAYNVNETQPNPALAGADVRITSTAIASPYWAGEKGQSDSALSWIGWGLPGGQTRVQVQGVNFFFTDGGTPLTDPVILGGFIDGANSQVSVQAETDIQTVSSIPNQTILFGRGDGTRGLDRIYEFMNWTTAQTSLNDVGLRTNMNSYFKLTNLVPTGGFLSTYPGASAAYSVRRLSDEAQICMRVRRTVAPFDERNIGFDSNGDLDTAAIATFGGSDALTVSAWYDQSGNGNRVFQGVAASQPQIYDGTAVITENGKPAIDFVQNSSRSLNGPTFSNNSIMSFSVNREVTNRGTIWGLGGSNMYKTLEAQNWSNVQLLIFKGDGTNYDSATSTATRDFAQHLITVSRFSNALKAYIDGVSEIDTTDTYAASSGALGFGNRNTQGQLYLQEAIFYDSDQDSNRTAIEGNINSYYSIY